MTAGLSADPRALLGQASELHRAGRMDEALDAYRAAARLAPRFPDAHRRLAFALLQMGRAKEAVRAAERARDLLPGDPTSHVLVGAGLLLSGEPQKALAAFDQAVRIAPSSLEAHFQAGNALAVMGRHGDAITRYSRALEIDPRAPEPRMNRATALSRLGRNEEALADCQTLVEQQPWQAMHHVGKASTLLAMGQPKAALAAAEAALAVAPDAADALYVAAQAKAIDDLPAAIALLDKAVSIAGNARPDWQVRLAFMLRLDGRLEAALAACDRALKVAPRLAEALVERAEVLRALGQPQAALADADRAIALLPDLAQAQITRAGALGDLGRGREARAAVDRAVRAAPQEPRVRHAKAQTDLAEGRWAEGWAGYQAREDMLPPPFTPPPVPRWDGRTPPADLVVLAEQGIGDVIQFARLQPLLADRGVPARLYVSAGLAPLVSTIEPRIPTFSDLSGIPADAPGTFWVPLASLPGLIEPDPAHWPAVPYLRAPEHYATRWSTLRDRPGLKVGINWQGNPSRLIDIGRSAPLSAFASLAEIPGVTLVSLQHGPAARQIGEVPFGDRIVFFGDEFDAEGIFLDRAGAMAHLDLVISTDTSVAHLAGALGRPGIVALRAAPDWRWGLEGEQCAFYPTLRLFRQARAGDWDELFARIAAEVRRLAGAA
ncbi:tetratricopeptide repeat protein [Xanthobacteraceae bacterium A53D]